MDKYLIEGGRPLSGTLSVSGSKNACLPIMAATLLIEGEVILKNVPELMDVRTMAKVLENLGARIEWDRQAAVMKIDCRQIDSVVAPYELVKTMRASFLVMGPLLARFGRAEVSLPGGCSIGTRPVDFHLKAFREMGAVVEMGQGNILAKGKLDGREILLEFPSVGATENIMMAAAITAGTTIIENAAREPEIVDLANFLNQAGARVEHAGSARIEIHGVDGLKPLEYPIMADRIEAGTFLILGAMCRSGIRVEKAPVEHLGSLLDKMKESGVQVREDGGGLVVEATSELSGVEIQTRPHPGFPTDLQAPIMAFLATVPGVSVISEGIFENRFLHIPELVRMGADIHLDGSKAIMKGVARYQAAPVMAGNLRAGASLVLAALLAKGTSEVSRIYHIDRGYQRLEQKLEQIGAVITRKKG